VEPVRITLLVEDLGALAAAVPASLRCPALERLWARGHSRDLEVPTANHLRFHLFGVDSTGPLPVAALTHVSDRKERPDNSYYWLRADPVTMWADMARVFMTQYGFADLNPFERNEIENCIRDVLRQEGFDLHSHHPERWCIPLKGPLDFTFTPLDKALGMDVADALPEHPEARHWRRILTEIQIALHNAPVNMRRRAEGRREINSVWFWGGGFIPEAAPHDAFQTIFSDDPVSRGLAIINDCRCLEQDAVMTTDLAADGPSIFIDWTVGGAGPQQELALLEELAEQLVTRADRGVLDVSVYDGSGLGRVYEAGVRNRFWRRRRPLSRILPSGSEE
jgi:hypothetical protein